MVSIEEMQEMLSELLDELPETFFEELNGGLNLVEDVRLDPAARENDLYILGEYCEDHFLGRTIFIYYGSFRELFGDLPQKKLRQELRKTVRHEFRHHVESLAGERGLELEDQRMMEDYLRAGERPQDHHEE